MKHSLSYLIYYLPHPHQSTPIYSVRALDVLSLVDTCKANLQTQPQAHNHTWNTRPSDMVALALQTSVHKCVNQTPTQSFAFRSQVAAHTCVSIDLKRVYIQCMHTWSIPSYLPRMYKRSKKCRSRRWKQRCGHRSCLDQSRTWHRQSNLTWSYASSRLWRLCNTSTNLI